MSEQETGLHLRFRRQRLHLQSCSPYPPKDLKCMVTNGSGTATANVTNVQVACVVGGWSWESGSNTGRTQKAFAAQSTASTGNAPGARSGSVSWTDGSGKSLAFGRLGNDSSWTTGDLNDLWEFNPTAKTWTGSEEATRQAFTVARLLRAYTAHKVLPQQTIYLGQETSAVSWKDGSGNFWLFGGQGYLRPRPAECSTTFGSLTLRPENGPG